MNLKKAAFSIVMLGLIVIAYFSFKIYAIMLVPNTAFNSKEAYVFISSSATYSDVRSDLEPLLLDIEKFDALAKQKKYNINVKAGRYRIARDMTNNDIINSLRSQNLAVTVSFNNQHSLALLAQRISNQVEADSLSLMSVFTDSLFLSSSAFSKESALAMYLPNSYELFWNTSAKKIRSKLQKAYKNKVIKRVLNKHKKIQSPYNTYMHTGLPPGLIAMPDLSAIDAVLNFESHSYFYFAADPSRPGFHRFAKTLYAHNANARRYQNYLNRQGIRK